MVKKDLKELLYEIIDVDFRYPKGSYYETNLPNAIPSGSATPTQADLEALCDTWFDPNYAWGGVWELELAGQVHVSANDPSTQSPAYPVSGANSNVSDGGSKDAIVPYHTHTTNSTNKTLTGQLEFRTAGSASSPLDIVSRNYAGATGGIFTSISSQTWSGSHVNLGTYGSQNNPKVHRVTLDATHTHGMTYAGSDGNTIDANMMPHINVYRWHRTA